MQHFVDVITRGVRPPRLREWYRRHPKSALVIFAASYALIIERGWRYFARERRLNRAMGGYFCQNPECPQAGKCGGECYRKYWEHEGGDDAA